jgi:hypothetical protein
MDNVNGIPISKENREKLYKIIEDHLEWQVINGLYFSKDGILIVSDNKTLSPLDDRYIIAKNKTKEKLNIFNPLFNMSHLSVIEKELNLYMNTAGSGSGYMTRIWCSVNGIIAEYGSTSFMMSRFGAILQLIDINLDDYIEG